jgi:hypothetical protein
MAQDRDPVALFLTSIVLACVETLGRHLTHALTHVKGALNMFTEYLSFDHEAADVNNLHLNQPELSALSIFARTLDLQNTTYKLSLPLQLSNVDLEQLDSRHAHDESHLLLLLHSCYSFAAEASKYKYLPDSTTPSNITEGQSKYISLLRQWRTQNQPRDVLCHEFGEDQEHLLASTNTDFETAQAPQRQLQCLSAIVYLSTILSPCETIFDEHYGHFLSIIQQAEVMIQNEGKGQRESRPRTRLLSYLSQPLFFTAMKCRDPHVRRKAIQLLSLTGKEGPWDAEILAAVATRAMEIEESFNAKGIETSSAFQQSDFTADNTTSNCNADHCRIPERARLHGCGMGHMTEDSGSPGGDVLRIFSHGSERRKIKFRFRRCMDIPKLLAYEQERSDAEAPAEYWEEWDELIVL